MIFVHHYDLFLLNSGGPDSTADMSKKSRLYVFFRISIVFLHLLLNLRHKWMLDIHSGKQTKLSKTMGSAFGLYGRNNSFTVHTFVKRRSGSNNEDQTALRIRLVCAVFVNTAPLTFPNDTINPDVLVLKHHKGETLMYVTTSKRKDISFAKCRKLGYI